LPLACLRVSLRLYPAARCRWPISWCTRHAVSSLLRTRANSPSFIAGFSCSLSFTARAAGASTQSSVENPRRQHLQRRIDYKEINVSVMKHVVVFVCAIFVASNVVAQDWAKERIKLSPRHSEYVDIKSGSRTIWVRVVYPESKEKTPVVIVVHEIFGV